MAGGAGPIHAGMVATELEIPMVIIPSESSVFCAAGMLMSDLRHDYVRTYKVSMEQIDMGRINELFEEMKKEGIKTLLSEGIEEKAIKLLYSLDLRYIGQYHEVEIPVPARILYPEDLPEITENFHIRHDELFGYLEKDAPVELINLRVMAIGITVKPKFPKSEFLGEDSSKALKDRRKVFFSSSKGYELTPVYDGIKMGYGNVIHGPAIVEVPTTTIVVTPEYSLTCDEYKNYVLYRKGVTIKGKW